MIEKIDSKDLFHLSPEDRRQLITESVELLLVNCSLMSKKYNRNLTKVINETIYNIELNKIIEEENENYELCYFYEELVWGVHNKLEEIKKIK
jgi:hypothetical protein